MNLYRLTVFTMFIFFLSCKNFKKNDNKYFFKKFVNTNFSSFIEGGVFLDDTLELSKEYVGEFRFTNKLYDSLNITNKDFRSIHVLIWISSKEKQVTISQIDTFSIRSNKLKDTLYSKFQFVPNHIGNNIINVDIEENIFLFSDKYFKNDKNRLLNNKYTFEFPVYVKVR